MESRFPAAAAFLLCACVPAAATPPSECPQNTVAEAPQATAPVAQSCDRCCSAFNHGGPRIIDAGWDAADGVVMLTFSEPVRAAKQVSPDQFRLSYATANTDADQAEVQYYDPLYYFGGQEDAKGHPELLRFVELEQVDETHIRLTASHPIEDAECPLEDQQPSEAPAGDGAVEGIFLHYTHARRGIEDTAGNDMRGFGAAWASHPNSVHSSATGTPPVHRIDLLIPVHCSEAAP